ncbi:MAG: dephospho-CoA kinase [Lutispora sp.]|nr:dephospho-CoA kinase [Lutispora sp.]MDD4833205.1 dephospho-CoA kinase [Lutispora sp.]
MIIGLTGGIASGKSTISLILKELGAYIIDVDEVGRNVVQKGEKAYNEIVQYFGDQIVMANGEINRKILGRIVFSNEEELKMLNSITHPQIIAKVKEIIEQHRSNGNEVIVVDAAILIEMGLNSICDSVWLVTVDKKTQLQRLMERDRFSYDDAQNRINAQFSDDKKSQYSDVIIDNTKSLEELKACLKQLWDNTVKRGEVVDQ